MPATLLQVGLRDATAPWYHVNDSTYQIDLAGELVLDGETPYGHDYRGSGLERWYPAVDADEDVPRVALDHFAYFPGTASTAAAWRLVPSPYDDYRIFVLLCTLALFAAALLFDAPLPWKLAAGAALAANPLADPRRVVRDGRRAEPAPDGAGLRVRHSLTLRPRAAQRSAAPCC